MVIPLLRRICLSGMMRAAEVDEKLLKPMASLAVLMQSSEIGTRGGANHHAGPQEDELSRFDLNLLASLDALLREKSVTLAAEQIGVSQPTMSGMLQRLREQLQDPILVRLGKSFVLTPRAVELAEEVRQALLTIESLVGPRGNVDLGTVRRHLRIMASEFTVLLLLPDVFRKARLEAPRLTFEVIPISAPVEQVYAGEVDLCITGNQVTDVGGAVASAIRTQTLMSDRFVAIVSNDHPLRGEITREEFYSYPHVVTQFPGIPRTVEDSVVDGQCSAEPPVVRVPSFIAVAAIVSDTTMIGIIPSRVAPLLSSAWRVRTLAIPPSFSPIPLRALWHERHDNDPVHKWLRSAVSSSCMKAIEGF
jgi:LysR family transcriptional regulator, nod-box dependent transcriptional activator